MSFGLLKHFKDLKKNDSVLKATVHFEHLILGHDLDSVLKLLELRKTNSEDSIRLISTRPLTRQMLIENYEHLPTLLRSKNRVEEIYRTYFDAKILPHQKAPLFFKEGKFYEFSGRAKSMDLLKGEDYFKEVGHKLEISSLFSSEDWDNLDQILKEHQRISIIESVEKSSPEDLVNKNEWKITFKDFTQLTCENLYIGFSPKKFLSLLSHKESVTKELIDFTSSVSNQAAITVSWILDKEIYPEERTLFIPQSMTHEWGHFIVEFDSYSYTEKTQACHVLFLVHDEEPQTEDLGAKIKLLKRVLDRAFPDIEKHITKEHIRFDDEMFIQNQKTELLEQLFFDYPTLKFLSHSFFH